MSVWKERLRHQVCGHAISVLSDKLIKHSKVRSGSNSGALHSFSLNGFGLGPRYLGILSNSSRRTRIGKSESVVEKKSLSANLFLYSSQEPNSGVLPVILCSGKGWEAFVWGKVPGFLVQVSCWLGKTLSELDSQNPQSPCQGRIIKKAAQTWEEEREV